MNSKLLLFIIFIPFFSYSPISAKEAVKVEVDEKASQTRTGYLNITTQRTVALKIEGSDDTLIKYYVTTPAVLKKERNPVLFLFGKGGCGADPNYHSAMTAFAETNGVQVYTFDWQHQGGSSAYSKNPKAVHIDSFDDYQKTLRTFLEIILKEHNKKDGIDVVSLSMGACNALTYCQQNAKTLPFRKVIALSPMVGFNTPFPTILSRLVSGFWSYTGYGESYALGQKPWRAEPCRRHYSARPHMDKECTNAHIDHFAIDGNSDDARHGVTYSWVSAAYEAVSRLNPSSIPVPTLIVTPKEDEVVPTFDQVTYASKIKVKGSKTVVLDHYPHDVFFSGEKKRQQLFDLWARFLYGEDEIKTGRDKGKGMTIYDMGFDPKPYDPDAISEEEEALTTALSFVAMFALSGGESLSSGT